MAEGGPPSIHTGHVEEDWLMSYADFVTVLMGFFLLMYAISEPNKEKFNAVAESFSQALGTGNPSQSTPFLSVIQQAQTSFSTTDQNQKADVSGSNRSVNFDFKSQGLFKAGSAELLPEAVPQLDRVSQLIAFMGIQKYQVDVEGHTDDTPIAGGGPYATNWELSAARATNVVKFLINRGVDPQRLRAISYADTRPKVPNRDAQGRVIPQNQAENRRIVIRVER
jgi:chemotaxis protein MotB